MHRHRSRSTLVHLASLSHFFAIRLLSSLVDVSRLIETNIVVGFARCFAAPFETYITDVPDANVLDANARIVIKDDESSSLRAFKAENNPSRWSTNNYT